MSAVKKPVKAKKPAAAKKSAVPKADAKEAALAKEYISEITKNVKKLSSGDLKYLLQQSKILLQNKTVSEHNKKVIAEYNSNIEKRKVQAAKTAANAGKNEITVKEGKVMAYLLIRINQRSSSFVLQEMKRLVKIAHAQAPEKAGIAIYNFLRKERGDVIETQNITGPGDKKLADLAKFLTKHYTTAG